MARIWLTNTNSTINQTNGWPYKQALVDTRNPLRPALTLSSTVVTAQSIGPASGLSTASGGNALAWITMPMLADVAIPAEPVLCNVWGLESANNANVGFMLRLAEYTTSEQTAFLASSTASAELGSLGVVRWITANPTATTIDASNRLVIKLDWIALDTTTGIRFVNMDFDGPTEGADGDTYFDFDVPIRVNQNQLANGSTVTVPGIGHGQLTDFLSALTVLQNASLVASNTTVQQLQDGIGYGRNMR